MKKNCYEILVPPRHDAEGKTIVVMGAARGGTSVISGTLRLMGVFMGHELGQQHEDPKFRKEVPLAKKILTIRDRNEHHRLWGWKLPGTISYLGNVFSELRNPHLAVIYRNPLGVARSYASRDRIEFSQARIDGPISYYQRMHNVIKMVGPCPRIAYSYEAILSDKDGFLASLSDFCGIVLTDDQRKACLDFIDPNRGYTRLEKAIPANSPAA